MMGSPTLSDLDADIGLGGYIRLDADELSPTCFHEARLYRDLNSNDP